MHATRDLPRCIWITQRPSEVHLWAFVSTSGSPQELRTSHRPEKSRELFFRHLPQAPVLTSFDNGNTATTTHMYKGTTKNVDLVRILRERDYLDDSVRLFAKWQNKELVEALYKATGTRARRQRSARSFSILDIDSYFHNRILRWAGHVARMPMSRAPRQLLTGWVSHSRPVGCPQMTWGRTLENALKSKGISNDFDEWIAIAKVRLKWRQLTHSIPKPPGA